MSETPKFSFGGPAAGGSSTPTLFGSNTGGDKPAGSTSVFGQSTGNTPSLFGAQKPASGGDNSSSLFGGASKSSGSGFSFGNTGGGSGLFGGGSNTPGSTGVSFGQKPADAQKSDSGDMKPPTSNVFGSGASAQPATGGSLFQNLGNNTSSQPTSGAATPAPNKTSASLFSTTPAGPPPASGQSLFGGAKPATGGALFGQKTDNTSSAPATGGLFGQKTDNTASAPATGGLFGQKADNTASAPATGGLFGAKPAGQPTAASTSQSSSSLFGNAQPSAQTSSNLFDGAAKDAEKEKPKPSFGFPPSSTGNAPSLFGAKDQAKPAETSQPAKPTFSLGQPSSAPSAQASTSDASKSQTSTAPSLFGNLNKPAETPASTGSAPSLFGNLGQKKDEPAKSPAATTSTAPASSAPSLFGNLNKPTGADNAAKDTKPAAAPSSLFGSKPAEASTQSAPANGTTTTASAPTLGASTTGPAPSAASRLATKSLDEILALWTTSLTQHQKKFGDMATKISTWDRQLVENSNQISKLYARTFQAERDTSEVERQLSQVENEQKELEHYLDSYEKQVDEMIARAGGGDGGVDAERDRTYRTADRCSTRLTTMAHDLTSMIDEINNASTNLRQSSKSANTQDPLSQIVRVLNGHLGQLQQIDTGASQLQQKVTLAQREVRSLGRNSALGNDEVDSFARSYLGRR